MRQRAAHSRQPTVEILENRRLMSVDLTGAFASRLPKALPAAGTSQIAVRLANTGTTKAVEPVTVQLFASTTPSPNSGDILLATQQQNIRLKPRGSVNTRLTVPSPTNLPTGNYFLLAEVNGGLVTAAPVQIQAPFSDLAVNFAGLPGKPVEIDGYSAGQRAAVVDVTNDGNVPVNGKVNLSFYISNNNVLDANASLLQTISNANISLKPGHSKAVRFPITVPPGTAAGGYFLLAKMTGNGALANVTTANSVAVTSRRIAVVNQLPIRTSRHNQTNVIITGGAGGEVIDDGSSCDDGNDTDVAVGDGGSDTGDTSSYSDAGTTADNSDSADDNSSDDWGSDDDSSGGDF